MALTGEPKHRTRFAGLAPPLSQPERNGAFSTQNVQTTIEKCQNKTIYLILSVQHMSTSSDYCGTFEAARMLGLSVGTVQSLVERGELEAWKTQGGHRRIANQSLRDYQARHGNQGSSGLESNPMLRVLVVDDDLVTLEVVRAATEQWGLPLACTLMSSAVEALLQIGTLRPHVLLTDLSMPGVDGFELLHSLRSNPAFASMLLVAISGLSEGEVKAKGGLPADTVFLKKPLDLRWLHGFLSALVATRQLKAAQI